MTIARVFGQVLHDIRIKQGITQEKLAQLSNLDRTYISMLERGLRQPTLHTLFTIAKTLEIEPSQFIKKIEDLYEN